MRRGRKAGTLLFPLYYRLLPNSQLSETRIKGSYNIVKEGRTVIIKKHMKL